MLVKRKMSASALLVSRNTITTMWALEELLNARTWW